MLGSMELDFYSVNRYVCAPMCCFSGRDNKAAVGVAVLRDAKQVLDQWKISYFKMRAEIEESGSYSRWEFDRRRLFERTDYMASICQDLCNVLQVCVQNTLILLKIS